MPRLFVPDSTVRGDSVHIGGDAARHLAGSLRVRSGDTVRIVDPDGIEYVVTVGAASTDGIDGTVLARHPAAGEPALRVEVIQAIAKDGMDEAVDAMVQAGVGVIRPVITERTVARPDDARARRRVERWQSIARETAQLAFRARIPEVAPIEPLAAALGHVPNGARLLACVIAPEAVPIGSAGAGNAGRVVICIGPEGGFGDDDLAALRRAGAVFVHLGARVVRSRLAAALAATLVLASSGDLDHAGPAHLDGTAPAAAAQP